MASEKQIADMVVESVFTEKTNVELEEEFGIAASEIKDLRNTETWNLVRRLIFGEIARIEVAKRLGVILYPYPAEESDKSEKEKADRQ